MWPGSNSKVSRKTFMFTAKIKTQLKPQAAAVSSRQNTLVYMKHRSKTPSSTQLFSTVVVYILFKQRPVLLLDTET